MESWIRHMFIVFMDFRGFEWLSKPQVEGRDIESRRAERKIRTWFWHLRNVFERGRPSEITVEATKID